MNFLSHFAFNHDVGGLAEDAYFVAGVTLPDLWPQFSRTRRLRWNVVRTTPPRDAVDAALRAGLLNHVAVDRRFHTLPAFLRWQRQLQAEVGDGQVPPPVHDFLAHLAVELALDRRLVGGDPSLPHRYYDALSGGDPGVVERRVSRLAGVDAQGLADVLRGFIGRRFLCRLHEPEAPRRIAEFVLRLVGLPPPPTEMLRRLLARAERLVEVHTIWAGLSRRAERQAGS